MVRISKSYLYYFYYLLKLINNARVIKTLEKDNWAYGAMA
jgi:hypothetical protein